ncbi:alpha-(1,3)-fucosyltransferase C-like [Helicoverpa zea]|uniref:alpha-(1,3)-fucosyltransferase C-like n=1 Tax=Helicoverpa zea TaxID=7113 RepID=UPI001F56BF00|nr:alpha-(1,3)-fucosyltransferase C-like [Helicoverpa zea]
MRAPYQKFVFLASESAANFPQCDDFFDDFYNVTWTYKLNSDIRWSYFNIVDKEGNTVGPRINMTWIEATKPVPFNIKKKIGNKKKAAAWFVSNCHTISDRQNVSRHTEKAMRQYNMTLDIFGWCGRKKCPKDRLQECLYLLENEYYFYFSFENSLCEDYVTEKILYPLQNYAVPVVFGGADYSRFLPPGSYINARERNATQIAEDMYKAITNPNIYENYFRWHNYYKYVKHPSEADICKLCQVLNEDKSSTYRSFRKWWNPQYASLCAKGGGRFLIMKPPI